MKNFKKVFCTLLSVMTIALTLCFGAVSASASASESVAVPVAVSVSAISPADSPVFSNMVMADKKGVSDLDSATDGDDAFTDIVTFFAKWIKRIGLLVAFVGAVMFALAIKNNDADQKQTGLLTMVAGFIVSALCTAIDMFGITA